MGEAQAAPGRCCQEDGGTGGLQEGGDESHDEMSFCCFWLFLLNKCLYLISSFSP